MCIADGCNDDDEEGRKKGREKRRGKKRRRRGGKGLWEGARTSPGRGTQEDE